MRQSAVTFKAKGLNFEGVIAQPEGVPGPFPAVVVCHPHPLFGGSMDNNVVIGVAYSLVEEGFVTLRFNFRGVGGSQGEHTKGEKEHEEALAALELIKAWPEVDGRKVGLAGYSFGTSVVLNHPELHKKARAIALVSPPLRSLEGTALKKSKQPLLIISGDRDKLIQSDQLKPVLDSFERAPEFEIVSGADHFWVGREDELCQRVSKFFVEHLA